VFEPTHGSAPKYAGQYKVNPIAMLLTAKLLLDCLKETEMATRLEAAIARVIAEGKVRTYEKHVRSPRRHGLAPPRRASCGEGGSASTLDIAKAVANYAA
jgi:hypothetical protein